MLILPTPASAPGPQVQSPKVAFFLQELKTPGVQKQNLGNWGFPDDGGTLEGGTSGRSQVTLFPLMDGEAFGEAGGVAVTQRAPRSWSSGRRPERRAGDDQNREVLPGASATGRPGGAQQRLPVRGGGSGESWGDREDEEVPAGLPLVGGLC